MATDLFQAPDYYNLDDLFTEEHLMVRDAARDWVKRAVSPIIEEACQKAEFPKQIVPGLGEIGAFGPYIPEEYGGAGQGDPKRSNRPDRSSPWSRDGSQPASDLLQ